MTLRAFAAGLLLAAASSGTVAAADLVIGTRFANSALDPHYHNNIDNASMLAQIYESLVRVDRDLRLQPLLADSWRSIDDLTWEFKLRKGVTFSDGSTFDAEDVIYTIKRIAEYKGSPGPFTGRTGSIKEVVAVDPHTIRVTTVRPTPLLPRDLSEVMIVSNEGKDLAPVDFNTGKAAIGTGAYVLDKWTSGQTLSLKRREGYAGAWGPAPWTTVTYKTIKADPSRVAALLAGDVDLVDYVPEKDLETIKRSGKFKIYQKPAARSNFINLDTFRDQPPHVFDHAGKSLPTNPLKDLRVRQALSVAIDRQLIVDKVLGGAGTAASQMFPAGFAGVSDKVPALKQDIAQAKKLLAEAGYPNGFRVNLFGTLNRYSGDADTLQVVRQFWAQIGVLATVEALPSNVYFQRADAFEFSVFYAGGSGDHALVPASTVLHTPDRARGFGTQNRGRYSNPAFDAALEKALTIADEEERNKVGADAVAMVMADVPVIPLYHSALIFATGPKVGSYDASPLERTMALLARP